MQDTVVTSYALLAQYDGKVIIPLSDVVRDFFPHLTVDTFKRKVVSREIVIPLVRMDESLKSAVAIHVDDLASYIDSRTRKARKESEAFNRNS